MKIFNKEENKEVVYVQKEDLMQISLYYSQIPESIANDIKTFFQGFGYNSEKFVRYEDPEALEFFKNAHWIIDYKTYRELSTEELNSRFEALLLNRRSLSFIKYHFGEYKLSDEARHNLLYYEIISLINYELVQTKQKTLPFPSVIDSDGKAFSKYKCTIQSYIDGDTFILYRNNHSKFNNKAKVPMEFIDAIKPESANSYTEYLAKDNRCIIVKFKYDNRINKNTNLLAIVRQNIDKLV